MTLGDFGLENLINKEDSKGLQVFQDDDEIRKLINDILEDVKARKIIYTKEE